MLLRREEKNMNRILCVSIALVFTGLCVLAATPPALINYQGVLRDASGNPSTGSYDMIFRFYDASSSGNLLLTDTHNAAAPSGQVTVSAGLFNARLGEGTIAAGTEPDLSEVFRDNSPVWLEIQIGSETLAPRVQVISSAYAQNARTFNGRETSDFASAVHEQDASTITSGALSAARGGTGSDTSGASSGSLLTAGGSGSWGALAPGSDGQILKSTGSGLEWIDQPASGGDNDWTVSGSDMYSAVSGNVGIGTSTYSDKLTLKGSQTILGADNPSLVGSTTANLAYPMSVCVSGAYAYVTSLSSNSLCIYDVSNPANIVARGTTSQNLSSPNNVFVSGSYAYVVNDGNSMLAIFDVSDPNNIIAKGTMGGLSNPWSVYVSGRYAYVACYSSNRLSILDISNPDNIVARGYTSTNLSNPVCVQVSGKYAYVTTLGHRLAIFDVSDPDSIVALGVTGTNLNNPRSVYVSGGYAYVVSEWNNSLSVFDVSNPNSIVLVASTTTNLSGPMCVQVSGKYAYVASWATYGISVFDVSNPASIVAKGFSGNINSMYSSAVSGRYAYALSAGDNRLSIFDLNHLDSPTASIGGLQAGNLSVRNDVTVGSNMYVRGSLNVGQGGALVSGDLAAEGNIRSASGGFVFPDGTIQTTAAGTAGPTGWTISGSDEYSSVSGNVGIGTTSPGQKLQIGDNTVSGSEGMMRMASMGTGGAQRIWDIGVPMSDTVSTGKYFSFVIDDTLYGTDPEFMIKWGTGNVGIGTTSPVNRLDVEGAAAIGATFSGASAAPANGMIVEGNVGIGTASPDRPLTVKGTSTNEWISLMDNANAVQWHLNYKSGLDFSETLVADYRLFLQDGGNVGIGTNDPQGYKLAVNGSAAKLGGGSWSSWSDLRLKDIQGDFTAGLEQVLALKPYFYRYKNGNAINIEVTRSFVGPAAQEVQKAIPEAVEASPGGYLLVNNEPIFWAMVNAIKELDRRTKDLSGESADAANEGQGSSKDAAPADIRKDSRKLKDQNADRDVNSPAAGQELYPVCEAVEYGDLLVTDPTRPGYFCLGRTASDPGVFGIAAGSSDDMDVSRNESMNDTSRAVPAATSGVVYCKADAAYGSIKVNDLLCASPNPGHAMKASKPFEPGTIVGKALEPIERGTGLIKILVMLR